MGGGVCGSGCGHVGSDSGLGFAVGLRGEICREKERGRDKIENQNNYK